MYFDPSLLECELTSDINFQNSQNSQNFQKSQSFRNSPHPISAAFKRNREREAIDLRSPSYGNKKQDFRHDARPDFRPDVNSEMRSHSSQEKG